jgi:hypothetical protein
MTSTSRLRDTEDTPKDNRGVFGFLARLLPDETALTGSGRRLRREPFGRDEERGAPGRVRGQSRTPTGPATESCQWLDGTSDMLGWGGRRARGMERRTCWAGTRAASSPHGSSEVFGRVPRTSPSSSSGAPPTGSSQALGRAHWMGPLGYSAGPTASDRPPWGETHGPGRGEIDRDRRREAGANENRLGLMKKTGVNENRPGEMTTNRGE